MRLLIVALAIALIAAACGGSGDELERLRKENERLRAELSASPAPTATATLTPTSRLTVTATATPIQTAAATPPPVTRLTPTAQPTPAAPALELLSFNGYIDSLGYVHVVGEVRNNTSVPAQFVKAVATFYDSSNRVVGTDFTYSDLDVVWPGSTSPFHIIATNVPDDARFRVQLEGREARGAVPAPLEILSHSSYTDSLGYRHIVGEVRNHGSLPLDFVKVVATLYDAAGEVVATDFTYSDLDTIAAGGTSPFEMIVTNTAGAVDTYLLQVDGN